MKPRNSSSLSPDPGGSVRLGPTLFHYELSARWAVPQPDMSASERSSRATISIIQTWTTPISAHEALPDADAIGIPGAPKTDMGATTTNKRGSPETTDKHGRPETTDKDGHPKTTDKRGRPETTDKRGRPETTDKHGSPGIPGSPKNDMGATTSKQIHISIIVEGSGLNKRGRPETTDKHGRPETTDKRGRPETTDKHGCPETTDKHRPETTDKNRRPETTDKHCSPERNAADAAADRHDRPPDPPGQRRLHVAHEEFNHFQEEVHPQA